MPKRNILFLLSTCLVCLAAWAARERGGHGRRFGEVLEAIERRHLEPADPGVLFDAAIDAAVGRLDEHSAYLRGAVRADIETALDQRFAGVGLELALDKATERPRVVTPVFDSPAWRAGIAPGDLIESVAGLDTRGRPLREIVERLRGRAGEPVTLRIAASPRAPLATLDPAGPRPERAVREVVLVREEVRLESVLGDRRHPDGTWSWLLEGESGVGFVRITNFGERTAAEFARACEALAAEENLRGIVIDLRGNPGGLFQAAVDVCDALIDEGVIVSTRGRGEGGLAVVAEKRATAGRRLADVPIAVLIDGLSSSAAEIVAACLQDAGRVTVVGSRTFGKGTIQTIMPLSDDAGLLKLTTAEYLRPSREPIHRAVGAGDEDAWGVRPDRGFEVTPTAEAVERLRTWRLERDACGPPGAAAASGSAAGPVAREIDAVLRRALGAVTGAE